MPIEVRVDVLNVHRIPPFQPGVSSVQAIDSPPADIPQTALDSLSVPLQRAFSPSDHPTLRLDPDKQPARADIEALDRLDEVRVGLGLCETGVRLCGDVSLDTLGVLEGIVGRGEVGRLLLRELGGFGASAQGPGSIGVWLRHGVEVRERSTVGGEWLL